MCSRHRSGRRWPMVGAVLTFGALVAAACSSDDSDGAATTAPAATSAGTTEVPATSAEATQPSPTSGASTTAPSYETAPCPSPNYPGAPQLDLGPEFECGFLTVPEDRSQPDGPTIRIAVAKAAAATPNAAPDPIVYLAGGPGGTGIVTATQRVNDGWNRDRDVIFLDQRGEYHAEPLLSCPEVDEFFAAAVSLPSADPATYEQSAAATQACRDRLAGDGWILGAYNTTENAADIADLRVAMGIDEWNLYGVSYGTDLALQTLRDHPEGIRSVVLDSVVPPQLNLMDGFWPNAAEGYRALFDACAAQPACTSAFPDVEAQFNALVTELAAQPRVVTVPDPAGGADVDVVVDGYALANLVVVASLSPGSIAGVPSLINNLATGDGTAAAAAMLAGRPPVGVTGYGLAYGVFCAEQAAFTNLEQAVAAAREVLPGFPESVLSLLPQSPRIFDDCAIWDVPQAAASVHDATTNDVPVLLITGTLDAITPPSWADAAASELPNPARCGSPARGTT